MSKIAYFKITQTSRDSVSEDSSRQQTTVRTTIESLFEPTLAQRGVWLQDIEIENDIMTSYYGFSEDRRTCEPIAGTVESDVRYIAEHVQLYGQYLGMNSPVAVLLHVRLDTSKRNGKKVEQAMCELGYSKFEVDVNGYMRNLKAADMTPADVMRGELTFRQLLDLLTPKAK